jgi:sulfate adenylyltransferase
MISPSTRPPASLGAGALIPPHGGRLVNRLAPEGNLDELRARAARLPRVDLTLRELCDLELLATGALSPLDGFVGERDFRSIVTEKRLAGGLAWTIPITLSVSKHQAASLPEGRYAALAFDGRVVALVEVAHRFEFDREEEALAVYGTRDPSHPGVKATLSRGEVLVGGTITLLERVVSRSWGPRSLDPAETRAEFGRRGWRRVSGFQTRNPIHRAHEHITKVALETVDGLLVHPLVGETKDDDLPAEVRMRACEALLEKYYPAGRVLLAALPAAMRYAGPREAVHHAILRQNHGCSHFIVGRDHAGVGSFYGPFDAHRIFDEFDREELAITPLFFDAAFWCRACGGMASAKTCPHGASERVALSGTQVRATLAAGGELPEEFTRPEVADVLRGHYAGCTAR